MCTIWVASKSSWDSSRSRQAKNLVDAKKLGRSDELHHKHTPVTATAWGLKRSTAVHEDIIAYAMVEGACYLLPSPPALLSSSGTGATLLSPGLLAPSWGLCCEGMVGRLQVARVTSGSLPVRHMQAFRALAT